MDPTEVYLEMFYAMRDGRRPEARRLALKLRDWFDNGGYPPPLYTEIAVKAYMFNVLRRTIDLTLTE